MVAAQTKWLNATLKASVWHSDFVDVEASLDSTTSGSGEVVSMHSVHVTKGGDVALDGSEAAEAAAAADATKPPMVLLHGFGTGAAIYAQNMETLAEKYDVYSVDMVGCGLSGRPKHNPRDIDTSEALFTNTLESWRRRKGLGPITLVGHSFGGYIAGVYALKHPQHVERLVLLSPVGVPERPPPEQDPVRQLPWFVRPLVGTFRALWSLNVSPQGVLRALGPAGPRMTKGYVNKRFTAQVADKELLAQYLYHASATYSTSEAAIQNLLQLTWAYRPLVRRLDKLECDTVFMYGTHDWMDVGGAYRVQQLIDERHNSSSSGSPRVPHTLVLQTEKAGHNLFLDNPAEFNEQLMLALSTPPSQWRQLQHWW